MNTIVIVSIFSREKHFPLRIFTRCIAFTMQLNDSWYCFKDRRYSSYISSRKRDARRENRELVARFQHGGIASLPAIIRGIEISEAFEKSHRQWKYFSLACSSLFIIVLYSFFYPFLFQEIVATLSKTEMSHEIIPLFIFATDVQQAMQSLLLRINKLDNNIFSRVKSQF